MKWINDDKMARLVSSLIRKGDDKIIDNVLS